MSTLLKAKKDFKVLMVANRPDKSWHKEVKSDAGVLEALVIGSFDEIEQIETSFKETRRLSQQIEDAIESFEDLKIELSTGDSNKQCKRHHKTILLIIEDTGAVNGADHKSLKSFNAAKNGMFKLIDYDEDINTSVNVAAAVSAAQLNSSMLPQEPYQKFNKEILPFFNGDIKHWVAFRDK